jgi:hypothetical protein
MDFSVVLNHLQDLYLGQLVLYCDDIAKILRTSDKAIDHLIARDRPYAFSRNFDDLPGCLLW